LGRLDGLPNVGRAAAKIVTPKLAGAIFIFSAAVLFLPVGWLVELGLDDFKQSHKTELAAALFASGSLLIVQAAVGIKQFTSRWLRDRRFRTGMRETLAALTADEKQMLRPYIFAGENTVYESIYDGVANGLIYNHRREQNSQSIRTSCPIDALASQRF